MGTGESQGKSYPPGLSAESWNHDQGALFEPESSRGSVQTEDAAGFPRPQRIRKQGKEAHRETGEP
jgi:hypothetical protein